MIAAFRSQILVCTSLAFICLESVLQSTVRRDRTHRFYPREFPVRYVPLDGELRGETVRVAGDARQRFHDSRGYGRSLGGNEIALSRVEAAHLLFRGDLGSITAAGDELDFPAFFGQSAAVGGRFAARFLVYTDLRDRGFYLSPAKEGWSGTAPEDHTSHDIDFTVYERGADPGGAVAYRVCVLGERESIAASGLAGLTLAIVDEESDISYFSATRPELTGETPFEPPADLSGLLLEDRVVVWDTPPALYEYGFYGRPISSRGDSFGGAVQLSLVEAASLIGAGQLSLSGTVNGAETDALGENGASDIDTESPTGDAGHAVADPRAAVVARGRAVEGERFDRRLRVYERLRGADLVPKTGYKFGADFRTYRDIDHVDNLPHSEHLIRVVESDHVFDPRDLALDVRLAGGVRKRMLFGLAGESVSFVEVGRLTP